MMNYGMYPSYYQPMFNAQQRIQQYEQMMPQVQQPAQQAPSSKPLLKYYRQFLLALLKRQKRILLMRLELQHYFTMPVKMKFT